MPTDKNLKASTTRKTGLQGGAGGDVRGDNVAWSGGPPAVSPISLGDNTERAANFHPTTDYETEAPLGTSAFVNDSDGGLGNKADIPVPTVVTLTDPSSDGDLVAAWTTPDDATIQVELVLLTANEYGDFRPVATVRKASNADTHSHTFSGLTNGVDYKLDARRSGDSDNKVTANSWGPFAARTAAVKPTV